MKFNPYLILGVAIDAKPETIKAAYKKLANIYHPDKIHGDAEFFKKIKKAYELLINPSKRSKFDDSGTIDESIDNDNAEMLSFVFSSINAVIDSVQNPESMNIIECLIGNIKRNIDQLKKQILNNKAAIDKRTKLITKITVKDDSENLIIENLKLRISEIESMNLKIQDEINKQDRCITFLMNYDIKMDASTIVQVSLPANFYQSFRV